MIDGVELEFSVRLRAATTDVWNAASTMRGVNDELRPIIRMTYPRAVGSLTADAVTPGTVLFRSWLLLGGVVPIDRHALVLERVIDGGGSTRSRRPGCSADGGTSAASSRRPMEAAP